MHQKTADNRAPQTPVSFPPGRILVENANRCYIVTVAVEVGRVA